MTVIHNLPNNSVVMNQVSPVLNNFTLLPRLLKVSPLKAVIKLYSLFFPLVVILLTYIKLPV